MPAVPESRLLSSQSSQTIPTHTHTTFSSSPTSTSWDCERKLEGNPYRHGPSMRTPHRKPGGESSPQPSWREGRLPAFKCCSARLASVSLIRSGCVLVSVSRGQVKQLSRRKKTNRHYPRLWRGDVLFHFRHDSCVTPLKQLAGKRWERLSA